MAGRYRKFGKGIFHRLQLQVAALGNFHGALKQRPGESGNSRDISSALFTKNWSLSNLKRLVS